MQKTTLKRLYLALTALLASAVTWAQMTPMQADMEAQQNVMRHQQWEMQRQQLESGNIGNQVPPGPRYVYKAALAMDEFGMGYGLYSAVASKAYDHDAEAVAACEQSLPFGKCRVVASIVGGGLALAWDAQRGAAFWGSSQNVDYAKRIALNKCNSPNCQIFTWVYAPRGTVYQDEPMSQYGWLPGNGEAGLALQMQMLKRQNPKLYRAWAASASGDVSFGESGMINKEDATRSALDACNAFQTGACEPLLTYDNTCASIASAKDGGRIRYFTATHEQAAQAKQAAIAQCSAKFGAERCQIHESKCTGLAYGSLPMRYEPLSDARKAELKIIRAGR